MGEKWDVIIRLKNIHPNYIRTYLDSAQIWQSFLESEMKRHTLSVHGIHEIRIYHMFEIYS